MLQVVDKNLEGKWIRHKIYSMGIICHADPETDWLTVRFVKDNSIMRLSGRSMQITFI